ncbi:MAG: hypothetical protein H6R26_2320 [Proteobacteria bacterium]|nr:hypothetical protein [Pseudomonadota bacterium]
MGLSVPHYIRSTDIQDTVIRYEWDNWDPEGPGHRMDEEFCKRLENLSQRAAFAYAIATAEWIVYRYGRLSDDPLPWQYLEAAWAQVIDIRYAALSVEGDANINDWAGPIRRPIWRAILYAEYAGFEAHDDALPSDPAARNVGLAQYIITDPTPFRRWSEQILERLETHYPMNPEEHLGEVVPREALDPDFNLRIEQTESLINKFLAGLDYRANPFLNLPERMLRQGFEGTPYVFSIEEDRRHRFEW